MSATTTSADSTTLPQQIAKPMTLSCVRVCFIDAEICMSVELAAFFFYAGAIPPWSALPRCDGRLMPYRSLLWLALLIGLLAHAAVAAPPPAQNDSDEPATSGQVYADIVRSDQPVAYWRFEDDRGTAEFG